jgi:hypothetical protein
VPVFTQGLTSALLYGVDVDTETFLISLPQHSQTHQFANISEARFAYWSLRDAAILLARDMAIKMFQTVPPSALDLRRQGQLLECHHSWFNALLALEREQKLSTEDMVAMNALKVGYYSTYTASACVNDAGQMSFDAHLDSFKALLVHAKVLITDGFPGRASQKHDPQPNAAADFTFDAALVPALFYTALRCRCPTTRREAIVLLTLNIPREGLWDPEKHRIVAEQIVKIEEKAVDERGWPLARARLWNGAVTADIDTRKESHADFSFTKSASMARVPLAPGSTASFPRPIVTCGARHSNSACAIAAATDKTSNLKTRMTSLPSTTGSSEEYAPDETSTRSPSLGELYMDVPIR